MERNGVSMFHCGICDPGLKNAIEKIVFKDVFRPQFTANAALCDVHAHLHIL